MQGGAIKIRSLITRLCRGANGKRETYAGGAARRALPRAGLALVVLVAATTWLWHEASAEASRLAQARFAFKVKEAQFAIDQRLKAYEQVLRGGVGLFAASDGQVRREAWHDYVRALETAKNYPGIQGIGFALRILPSQLEAHVKAVRAAGFADYQVRPVGTREEYTAIVYLEPFDWRNQRAFGYDMFSEPVRHAAMVAARDSGQPGVSGKVTLVQETSKEVQNGFLMYLPVYRRSDPVATAEQRRAALLGYVYAPFRMNDLMHNVLEPGISSEIDLQIFDGSALSPETLLYDSQPARPAAWRGSAAFISEQHIDFNGRRWILRFRSAPAFDSVVDVQKPQLILFGGLLISVMFTLIVWWSSVNRQRARQIAAANRDLRHEIEMRTQLATQLERAKNQAEAASKAKGEFVANVSHELRTPLTLMLGPLDQLLAKPAPSPSWREQTERVRRNALVLLNRVNDILDFSKAEVGKLCVHGAMVDLRQEFGPTMEDAAAAAQLRGCALTWHIDDCLGPVCVDPNHLYKILMNLVSNALKFTPSGGCIDVAAQPLDGEWFELAVSDTGLGIAPESLPHLFERFHQVDSSATRHHGGTGIGLALVRELTEAMGGRVGVQSRLGKGSRFFVRLRRRGMAYAAAPAQAQAGTAALQTQAALRRAQLAGDSAVPTPDSHLRAPSGRDGAPCVLLVDDHADMRGFIADLLTEQYDVVLAEDGEQAWTLLQRHPVALVVSDVMMPRVDGLVLTARIKSSPHLSHLPVILLTARGGDQACVSGLTCGADDYIAKPFSPDELQARVRAALRMGHVQAQLRERTREAGMAMVATGLLHNLGNALSGVTVSSSLIRDRLLRSKASQLRRVAQSLRAEPKEGTALSQQQLEALPAYVSLLADHLEQEQAELLKEVDGIRRGIEHALAVIAAQQDLATPGAAVDELHGVNALMDAAVELAADAFRGESVTIERDYCCDAAVVTDRHKVLQILLNLLRNAYHALAAMPADKRRITLSSAAEGDHVRLQVSDGGVGIPAELMGTLFNQGFTTKPNGHGYGLHSSANWAHELGGRLTAHSAGAGRGATFTLELPLGGTSGQSSHDTLSRQVEQ